MYIAVSPQHSAIRLAVLCRVLEHCLVLATTTITLLDVLRAASAAAISRAGVGGICCQQGYAQC